MSTRLFPIFTPAAADKFATDEQGLFLGMRFFEVANGLGTESFQTAALKFGEVVSLLAISMTDSMLTSGIVDSTDHTGCIVLHAVWIQTLSDGIKKIDYNVQSKPIQGTSERNHFIDVVDELIGELRIGVGTDTGMLRSSGNSAIVGYEIEIVRENVNRQFLKKIMEPEAPPEERLETMLDALPPAPEDGEVPAPFSWVSTVAQIRRNLFCKIVNWPADIDEKLKNAVEAIFERHPMSIYGLTMEIQDNRLAYSGEPAIVVNERFGYPMFNALVEFGRLLASTKRESNNTGWEVAFIEPDVTHTQVVNVWMLEAVTLYNVSGLSGARDIREAPEPVQYTITLRGDFNKDDGANRKRAQLIMDQMVKDCANPYRPVQDQPFSFLQPIQSAINTDFEYAWSWQCNLAMAFYGAYPEGQRPADLHQRANEGAATFMYNLFGVDMRSSQRYKDFDWAQQSAADPDAVPDKLVEIGQYEGVDMTRYTMSWKDFLTVGTLLPGATLYAKQSDIDACRQQREAINTPSTDVASTVMDKDRLDSAQ